MMDMNMLEMPTLNMKLRKYCLVSITQTNKCNLLTTIVTCGQKMQFL